METEVASAWVSALGHKQDESGGTREGCCWRQVSLSFRRIPVGGMEVMGHGALGLPVLVII